MMSKGDRPEKVRWGILGCARVAEAVMASAIQGSRNGMVLAVASRSLARSEAFAKQFSIERAYGCYEALLDDPEVQAVYIPLPNSLHKDWTVKAATKSKHVMCEKPLASCAPDAEEMSKACLKHGVILMEAFADRFQTQNVLVKKLVNEGRIGKLLWM